MRHSKQVSSKVLCEVRTRTQRRGVTINCCSIKMSTVFYSLSNHSVYMGQMVQHRRGSVSRHVVFVRFINHIWIVTLFAHPSQWSKTNRLICCASTDSLGTQKTEWMRERERGREATDRLCNQLAQIKIFGQAIILTGSWEGKTAALGYSWKLDD